MADKVFVDSNIWLYLFLQDKTDKYKIAEEFISKNADNLMFISYQVINEVTNQLVRNKFSEEVIKENIEYMYKICTIHNFSKEILLSASSLREKYSISFWDSIIIASALNSGCNTLATEDMHDGLKIGNMVVKNIFKQTFHLD
jgi:predicted nucleic acid-binding protein